MAIILIPTTALLVCILCSNVQAHKPKISSSVITPVSLSVERRLRSPRNKVNGFHTSETISPFYLRSSPLTLASTSTDHHFQWWDTGSSPELVPSGWYGFNHFAPREARKLDTVSNRKARTAFLLGESTHNSQIHPPAIQNQQANFKTASRHQTNQYDEDFAIREALRELQRHIRPLPQRQRFLEPRIIMLEEAIDLPPGLLVPVVNPHQQNSFQKFASYRPPQKDNRRLASAPTPVTIKVVPLKITSVDIANALKSMSFFPIPLELMQGHENGDSANAGITYDDKESDDEADLPPPSSHVATPLDQPLGITYAEAQRTEHYIGKYQPRR